MPHCKIIRRVCSNTAIGYEALQANTTGSNNVAVGANALTANTTGLFNVAVGQGALQSNVTASNNVAIGTGSLNKNTVSYNVAVGYQALTANTTGEYNTGIGFETLLANTTGSNNTALGWAAASAITTGSNNINIGYNAGSVSAQATGSNNINIGYVGSPSVVSGNIHIGTTGTQTTCYIAGIHGVTPSITGGIEVFCSGTGQLGTTSSARRYKENIQPLPATTDKLMQLEPVQFTYKSDEAKNKQYGLIAEDVYNIYPELIAYTLEGEIETVRYGQFHSLLLKGWQEQQIEVQNQQNELAACKQLIAEQKQQIAAQQEQIDALFKHCFGEDASTETSNEEIC